MTDGYRIHGAKGGSSSSGSTAPRTPIEAANTLRSKATARILDAICEGECVGLANGAKSIFFDRTPLQNIDGSFNFTGVSWEQRTGTSDQDWVRGFPAVETPHSVGVTVKAGAAFAVTRRISNLDANAVRVTVGLPSIFRQDTVTGDTNGSRVDFVVRIRRVTPTASWTDYPQAIDGKNMGAYQESYRLPLGGAGPWDVQVWRLTPDSTLATEQNTLNFDSFTELVDLALTYRRTALVGVQVDGELFGNNVPSRAYDWKGWIVRVPTILDGETRTYLSSFWDGAFKRQWTDDPAWLYYHLLTHPAGAGMQDSQVDKWALYEISRYCTERVPDGFGGFEPRFSANFVLNSRTEAYSVINALASSFRAMTYWSAGAVSVVADMPRDPDVLVSQADTVDGFEYTGAALKARHTVALVSYLDKEASYEQSIETVEDADGIERYGWNPVEINAFACTSRGQAHRLGKWTLDTEKTQSEGLGYKCSLNHLNVNPGTVAAVADPDYANLRSGGKVVSASPSVVRLDAPFPIEAGSSYKLMATLPNGTVETRNVALGPGTHESLTVSPAFSAAPLPESSWIVTSTLLAPRPFKILGIKEDDDLEFSVSAIIHDPTKYARVEQGIQFERPPFTRLPNPGVVAPPSDVNVTREYISTPTGFTDALQVTWTGSPDPFVRGYVVRWQKNLGAWQALPENPSTTATIYGEGAGSYTFHVLAVNFAGSMSLPAILRVDILNESPITLLRPTGLELEGQGNDTVFGGRDPVFVWRATAIRGAYPVGQEPAAGAGYLDAIFRDFEVRVYGPSGALVFTDHTNETRYAFTFEKNARSAGGPYRAFRFEVLMRDKWGNYSRPADLDVSNPAPAQPTNLQILPGVGSIFVSFDRPGDLDYAGTLVWLGEATGYAPGPATLAYEGDSTYAVVRVPESSVRFVRVAAYDSFGKTGLNVSAEFRVAVGGVKPPDFIPPAVPTGIALTTSATVGPDGTPTYRLRATWNANTEGDFLQYGVAIAQAGGDYVYYLADQPAYEWVVDAGATYSVKVRATDNISNASPYSDPVSITIGGDTEAPATPETLAAVSSFRTVWLQWARHPAPDFSHMEVWEAPADDRAQSGLVAHAPGTTFAREGMPAGETRWYWIRAVDRSGNRSGFYPASTTGGVLGRARKVEEADYQELSISNAFIKDGTIDDAKIASLDASKIRAGSVLSGSVTVDGRQLSQIVQGGGDPALAINAGTTQIDPGRIAISGGTTLASWRFGGDNTKINGGTIATGSIRANSLAVGSRAVDFVGIQFEARKETNTVAWSAGFATYPNDAGTGNATEGIVAGSAQFTGPLLYLYWYPGAGGIAATTDPAVQASPSNVVVGYYAGGVFLYCHFGLTVIDGDTIRTGTVHANRIQANTISARELSTGTLITNSAQIGTATINGAHIANAVLHDGHIINMAFDKLWGGTIQADDVIVGQVMPGYGHLHIQGGRAGWRRFLFIDANGIDRVIVGQISQTPNLDLDGLYVRNRFGQEVLTANGLGVNIVGEFNINGEAVSTGKIRAGAVTAMAYSRSGAVAMVSTTGGPMHVIANGLVATPNITVESVRIVANGAQIAVASGASGTVIMDQAVTNRPAGSTTTFIYQKLDTGSVWTTVAGATITVVEYKR
jgi:predicted phage tail protein